MYLTRALGKKGVIYQKVSLPVYEFGVTEKYIDLTTNRRSLWCATERHVKLNDCRRRQIDTAQYFDLSFVNNLLRSFTIVSRQQIVTTCFLHIYFKYW